MMGWKEEALETLKMYGFGFVSVDELVFRLKARRANLATLIETIDRLLETSPIHPTVDAIKEMHGTALNLKWDDPTITQVDLDTKLEEYRQNPGVDTLITFMHTLGNCWFNENIRNNKKLTALELGKAVDFLNRYIPQHVTALFSGKLSHEDIMDCLEYPPMEKWVLAEWHLKTHLTEDMRFR